MKKEEKKTEKTIWGDRRQSSDRSSIYFNWILSFPWKNLFHVLQIKAKNSEIRSPPNGNTKFGKKKRYTTNVCMCSRRRVTEWVCKNRPKWSPIHFCKKYYLGTFIPFIGAVRLGDIFHGGKVGRKITLREYLHNIIFVSHCRTMHSIQPN
jgi:hypothetical protein